MKLTIEGNESEIKNVLQAINGSKEHELIQKLGFRFSSSDSVAVKPHVLARTASN